MDDGIPTMSCASMRRMPRSGLLCLVLSAAACGAALPEVKTIMTAGTLRQTMNFDTPNATIAVTYVKAGECSTNVWINLLFGAKSKDLQFDPDDFELFDTISKISYKHSSSFFSRSDGSLFSTKEECGGRRTPNSASFSLSPSLFVQGSNSAPVRAGTEMPFTLVFEVQPSVVLGMTSVDLVYRGQHLALRPVP